MYIIHILIFVRKKLRSDFKQIWQKQRENAGKQKDQDGDDDVDDDGDFDVTNLMNINDYDLEFDDDPISNGIVQQLYSQRSVESLMVIDDEKTTNNNRVRRRPSEKLKILKNKKETQYITPLCFELYQNCLQSVDDEDQQLLKDIIGMDFKHGKNNLVQFHGQTYMTRECIDGRDPKVFTVM